MTKQELNRDIKRLWKLDHKLRLEKDLEDFLIAVREQIEPEFIRLYYADREMKYMNKQSIIILMSLNSNHRFLEPYQLELMVEVNND